MDDPELYVPPEAGPATSLGMLVFLPAALASVGLAAYWMHRALAGDARPAHRQLAGPSALRRPPPPSAPRAYSRYDLIAGCGVSFFINMCITIVVPVALSSAETRGHSSPLATSGSVAAATSIGMIVSVGFMYPWSVSLVESKLPALVFVAFLLAGNLAFLGAEWVGADFSYLLACRVVMSLGFGAGYAVKRRAGCEPDPRRREYLFMLLELASSVGMAAGPLLTGGLALLLPHRSLLLPPALMTLGSLLFAAALLLCPLDAPFRFSLPGAAAAPARSDEGVPLRPQGAPKEGTPLVRGGDGDGGGGAARAPTWVAATVQLTCLVFGVGRTFLKYGFESAMVVVYDRQLMYSEGVSGVVAGVCALSAVASMLLYRGVCVGRLATPTLLLLAEALGLGAAGVMVSTALLGHEGVPLAHAAALTASHPAAPPLAMLGLTLLASALFYPAMHALLSLSSMVAQQEVLQTTVGKGLGMMFCRIALGDPAKVSSLGEVFAVIMLVQSAVLAIGWEPRATIGRLFIGGDQRQRPAAAPAESAA